MDVDLVEIVDSFGAILALDLAALVRDTDCFQRRKNLCKFERNIPLPPCPLSVLHCPFLWTLFFLSTTSENKVFTVAP